MFTVRGRTGNELHLDLVNREKVGSFWRLTLPDLYVLLYVLERSIVIPAKRTHDSVRYAVGKAKMREVGKEILRRINRGEKDLTPQLKWRIRHNVWRDSRTIN